MEKRVMAATTAALVALLVLALPASAESGYTGVAAQIDWRLVVIFVLLGLLAFFAVQKLLNRGR